MMYSRKLLVFVIVAGLLGLLALSAGCSEPQQTQDDEFPPPNDAPHT
jgi:hypothetical protein